MPEFCDVIKGITVCHGDMCEIVIEELSEVHEDIGVLVRRDLDRRHAGAGDTPGRRKRCSVNRTSRLKESFKIPKAYLNNIN